MTESAAGKKKPAICVVAHNAYEAMCGGRDGFIGGVEWQTSFTAKWLAAKGYPVSILTWNKSGSHEEIIDAVRVIKLCKEEAGVKGLRFFHPKWTQLIRAMRRADADLYYQNCGEYVTGQVALWCRRHGRRFVYSVASDPDCDPRLPAMRTIRERVLYRYGLRHSDRIIVQTRRQERMLRDGFGRESVVIPMPCPGPGEHDYRPPPDPHGRPVLWMGRICEVKRPDHLLDLAEACPDLTFDLVGPIYDNPYARRVRDRAGHIPNVTAHGPVPRDRVPDFYQRASCLCCTSDYEGFPNTFLEAWSHGLPVVSTVDPDGLIATRQLGVIGQTADELVEGIRRLLTGGEPYRRTSANARRYYLENHTVETVMPQFERVFLEAANARSSW